MLDRYASQIQQSIERDGFYVRVPAGKQFYLYVTQTMDRADAKIGGEPVAIDRAAERPGNPAAPNSAVPFRSSQSRNLSLHLKTHSAKSMKRLLLILPVHFSLPVRTSTPKKIVIVPAFDPQSARGRRLDSVRRPEEVREYRFGRYVDPGSRLVMHEAHPVYRIERPPVEPPSGWTSPTARHRCPAAATSPDDAVVAEINKQKAATKAFTEQAATLNQRLAGLTDAVKQTKQMAEQQLLQQRDIAALKSRLNAVERERSEKPANTSGQTPPHAEEKW